MNAKLIFGIIFPILIIIVMLGLTLAKIIPQEKIIIEPIKDYSLLLDLPLNESSINAEVKDFSVYNHIGKVYNATFFPNTSKNNGASYYFDGKSYLVVEKASLDPYLKITISAWIKMTNESKHPMIVAKGINQGYILWQNDDEGIRRVGLRIGSAASINTVTSKSDIQLNQWYHVLGTYDGNILSLYLDGELENTKIRPGSINYVTEKVGIGASSYGQNPFIGFIENVKIYSSALNASEVKKVYNAH